MIVAALALAGCEDGTGGNVDIFSDIGTLTGANKTADQRALAASSRAYAQARVTGAAVGAGVGALACVLRECTPEQTAAAALIGGTAGYVGAAALTAQNAQFQVSQETLNRDLQMARRENANLSRGLASAQKVLSYQRSEVGRLNAAYRNGSVSASQYRGAYNGFQQDVAATKNLADTGAARVKELDSSISAHSRAGLNTSALRSERAKQQREVQRLRDVERRMIGVLGAVPKEVRG